MTEITSKDYHEYDQLDWVKMGNMSTEYNIQDGTILNISNIVRKQESCFCFNETTLFIFPKEFELKAIKIKSKNLANDITRNPLRTKQGSFGIVFMFHERLNVKFVYKMCFINESAMKEYKMAKFLYKRTKLINYNGMNLVQMPNLIKEWGQAGFSDKEKFFTTLLSELSKLRKQGLNHCDLHSENVSIQGHLMDPGCITEIGKRPRVIHNKFIHILKTHNGRIPCDFDIQCMIITFDMDCSVDNFTYTNYSYRSKIELKDIPMKYDMWLTGPASIIISDS
jgi:hypothetical protein